MQRYSFLLTSSHVTFAFICSNDNEICEVFFEMSLCYKKNCTPVYEEDNFSRSHEESNEHLSDKSIFSSRAIREKFSENCEICCSITCSKFLRVMRNCEKSASKLLTNFSRKFPLSVC